MPLENDPIMLGTSIRSFRHLEHQNPSNSIEFSSLPDGLEPEILVGLIIMTNCTVLKVGVA